MSDRRLQGGNDNTMKQPNNNIKFCPEFLGKQHPEKKYWTTLVHSRLDRAFKSIPAGTSKNDPSGDQANLRKKDGNVSS